MYVVMYLRYIVFIWDFNLVESQMSSWDQTGALILEERGKQMKYLQ